MVIDRLIEQIKNKKNPCIVGIDPEWSKIPGCYITNTVTEAENILHWATDVIDAVADIVPAVKPQMAFFEVFGAEGVRVHQQVIQYAHNKGLVVVDDSKRMILEILQKPMLTHTWQKTVQLTQTL